MTAPKTTTWDIEPHTRAKHAILKRYLQAWTPILASGGFPEVLYIDGFAGPGRYPKGEDGSPVIALRAALDLHARSTTGTRFRFLFVEKDPERAQMLDEIVDSLNVPENFDVSVLGGETFETAFDELFDLYKTKGGRPPPVFLFIDPFGWTGFPFFIIREVMGYRSCEVFVTFMYEEINRFIGYPDQKKNFDTLFGTEDWREGDRIADPVERNRFLHGLYMRQLQEDARARHVRSFEMRNNKGRVDYYLFYATNNMTGLKKMKEAMWKVGEAGEFRFSDATNPNQAVLFEYSPDFDALRRQIRKRFDGQETTVGEIEEFVLTETAFRETHYKVQVLKPLESAGVVEAIDPPSERRSGTYGNESLRLRFRRGSS